MMWPPVGALMWMQHAKSRLQDHHRERVYSSRLIRELFGAYPSYSQIFTSYSRAVCQVIFAATYSQLSADTRVLLPGHVPRHIRRHIFAIIRSLFTLILLQANSTNKS